MRLLIRCDANQHIGVGHLSRCLTLADEFYRNGTEVIFLMSSPEMAIQDWVSNKKHKLHFLPEDMTTDEDLHQTITQIRAFKGDMCIVDGYHFTEEYLSGLAQSGIWTCYMDDMINYHYTCHAVFNQNFYSPPECFSRAKHTDLILGPRFALLREEFLAYYDKTRYIRTDASRILVTMGGADPTQETEKVLQALEILPMSGMEARIVIGRSNPRAESIRRFCADKERKQIYVVRESISDMAKEMWEADLIISASGTTCMEFISLGTPGIVIVVVENQNLIGPELARRGLAVNIGWHEEVLAVELANKIEYLLNDDCLRADMSKVERNALDDRGAWRAVRAMLSSKRRHEQINVEGIVDLC